MTKRKTGPHAKTGRPSSYTPEKAEKICEQIRRGKGLVEICKQPSAPCCYDTVMTWLGKHPEFAEKYARAREVQMDHYAEEIISISDDGARDAYTAEDGTVRTDHEVVARARLRVDARKWLMSKLAPKKYGDKITAEHGGNVTIEVVTGVSRAPDDPL